MTKKKKKIKCKINKIEATDEAMTGRGGMALFVRYLEKIGIYAILLDLFGSVRKSKKGQAIENIFKQLLCFFYDGTSYHLSYFDELKLDPGYASIIETAAEHMCSSHQIKRFFNALSWGFERKFRKILKQFFIWRLKIENPEVIEIYIDTMVMDNNDAKKREGVSTTYKKVNGFQPLHIIWNGKIIDAIFRGGKKHGNNGDTVINMVKSLVKLIRKKYSKDIPIIIRTDAGFFDIKNYKAFDDLKIGFIASGKMYEFAKEYIDTQKEKILWSQYENGSNTWDYIEFGYRCGNWKKFYKAIYTKKNYDGNQGLLDFARTENLILTNLGVNSKLLNNVSTEKKRELLKLEALIESYHRTGKDELCHRGLKDFGSEQLPFKNFQPNAMFYYCMVLAFFLFETYKEDVLKDFLPITSYATTIRRKALDFAAKVVKTGGEIILKIPTVIMDNLKFELLWSRVQTPQPIYT